ncbi:MAG: ATP-binding protein [Dehalococcoidia bacterium]|nr:ATP-binding protein [Dehalococcoidia bacterium]
MPVGRHRPPWWPEGEDWPPAGGWRGRPRPFRPFVRGFGCLFGLLMLLALGGTVALGVAGAHALARLTGLPVPLAWLALLLPLVAVFLFAGPRLRWMATTLDDLGEAARRVEGGDYAVRVAAPVRGSPQLRALVRSFNTMTERLAQDDEARRLLLADVSHELRTPLAVIRGEIEAFLDGVHEATPEHLGTLIEETAVLERLIDDLRTLTLSEAGTLALHREPTDIARLLEGVVGGFQGLAAGTGVALTLAIPESLPALEVDPARIRQVFANLVDNALRHTPADGRVRVAAGVHGGELVVRVEDSGPGIPPALLARVFERFVKGEESRGAGLGLAIAKRLVDAHGGTIEASSEPGQGAVITVRLPVEG